MKLAVLSRSLIEEVLDMASVIEGVSGAYHDKAAGQAAVWPSVEYRFDNGGVMDIRSGYVAGQSSHGAKLLNNFPGNAALGLPNFSGLLMVFDSGTGLPMAVADASYITSMRTGAAAALGVRTLARENASRLLLVGSGHQAIFMLAAVLTACPRITSVEVWDPLDVGRAEEFAIRAPSRLAPFGVNADVVAVADLWASQPDAVVTVTRATSPVIPAAWVRPGMHLSCIGADMHGKQEVESALFPRARVFADDIRQCTSFGELEVPIAQGAIGVDDVCGELGEVLAGEIPGRVTAEDITVFDATGLALLDIVTARIALERAGDRATSVEI